MSVRREGVFESLWREEAVEKQRVSQSHVSVHAVAAVRGITGSVWEKEWNWEGNATTTSLLFFLSPLLPSSLQWGDDLPHRNTPLLIGE